MPKITVNKSDAKRIRNAVLTVERQAKQTAAQRPDAGLRKKLANEAFQVLVTIDGGSAGVTGASTCSFTYTVTNLAGTVTFGAALTPKARRQVNQKYTTTPDGTWGLGGFNALGVFVLIWANETTDCT